MVRSLFKTKYIVTCNREFEVLKDSVVVVEDDKIVYVGIEQNLPYDRRYFDFVIDEKNGILMPGLINCHTHAAMCLFKGLADDVPLMQWLEQTIWPLESKIDSESLLYGNYVAIMEMMSSGTTTFADFYFFQELIEAVKTIPIRSVATIALLDKIPNGEVYWNRLKDVKSYIEATQSIKDERVTLALGPHAIYTCSEQLLLEVMKVSNKFSLPIHIHISETKTENASSIKDQGMSPVKYLDRLGFLSNKVFGAHCVHLDSDDIMILSDRMVSCVHDPTSNLKLGSGIMPLCALLENGVNVCLGTDGSASSNSLNLLSEMRLAILLQRGLNMNPTFPTAKDALLMATRNGAKALGLDDKIGSIEVGKKADFIVLDGRNPRFLPEYNIISSIVYSSDRQDIMYTVVNGRILYDHGKFLGLNSNKILDIFSDKTIDLLKNVK